MQSQPSRRAMLAGLSAVPIFPVMAASKAAGDIPAILAEDAGLLDLKARFDLALAHCNAVGDERNRVEERYLAARPPRPGPLKPHQHGEDLRSMVKEIERRMRDYHAACARLEEETGFNAVEAQYEDAIDVVEALVEEIAPIEPRSFRALAVKLSALLAWGPFRNRDGALEDALARDLAGLARSNGLGDLAADLTRQMGWRRRAEA